LTSDRAVLDELVERLGAVLRAAAEHLGVGILIET
jgi:hypothetical protein